MLLSLAAHYERRGDEATAAARYRQLRCSWPGCSARNRRLASAGLRTSSAVMVSASQLRRSTNSVCPSANVKAVTAPGPRGSSARRPRRSQAAVLVGWNDRRQATCEVAARACIRHYQRETCDGVELEALFAVACGYPTGAAFRSAADARGPVAVVGHVTSINRSQEVIS
jgi:hypothetical protein